MRIYVAGYEPAHATEIGPAIEKFFAGAPPCPQTLIGVQALGMPGLRIEVEVMAVVNG